MKNIIASDEVLVERWHYLGSEAPTTRPPEEGWTKEMPISNDSEEVWSMDVVTNIKVPIQNS